MAKNHPLPKLYIEYEVRDKDGKIVRKGRIKSQSWVGNIVGLLSAIISTWGTVGSGYYAVQTRSDIIDTSGNARATVLATWTTTGNLGGCAPAGDTSAGILVGSSDAPVQIGQYNLQGLISHGTGANQLVYGATNVETITKNGTWYFRVVRTFTNNSGGTVTVREMGLFVKLGCYSSPYIYSVMLARDVISGGINLANGQTLTLRYIIAHSIS